MHRRQSHRVARVISSIAGLLIMALSGLSVPGGMARGVALYQESEPTATPVPAGNVLFDEDFDTYSNRWLEHESPKATVRYADDALALRVVSPGVSVWSVPDFGVAADSYTLRAELTFRGGSADSWAGCVVAYNDDANFYAFVVSPDGTWQFVQYAAGEWIDLTPPDAEAVGHDASLRHVTLRIASRADMFTFWIGEERIGSVSVIYDVLPVAGQDVSHSMFGVIARAGHGYVDVAFDTFTVSEWVGEE